MLWVRANAMMSAISKSLRSPQDFRDLFLGLVRSHLLDQRGRREPRVCRARPLLVRTANFRPSRTPACLAMLVATKSEGIVVDELLLEACALMLGSASYLSRAPGWGLKIVLGSRRAVTESVRPAKDA